MSLAAPLLGIGDEKGAITDEGAGAAGAGMCMSTSLCLCDACCLRYAHVQGGFGDFLCSKRPLFAWNIICIQHPCSSKPILISVPCKDCGVSSSRQATAAGQRDKKNAWPPHDCRAEIYDFPAYAGFRSQLRVSSYDKLLF